MYLDRTFNQDSILSWAELQAAVFLTVTLAAAAFPWDGDPLAADSQLGGAFTSYLPDIGTTTSLPGALLGPYLLSC